MKKILVFIIVIVIAIIILYLLKDKLGIASWFGAKKEGPITPTTVVEPQKVLKPMSLGVPQLFTYVDQRNSIVGGKTYVDGLKDHVAVANTSMEKGLLFTKSHSFQRGDIVQLTVTEGNKNINGLYIVTALGFGALNNADGLNGPFPAGVNIRQPEPSPERRLIRIVLPISETREQFKGVVKKLMNPQDYLTPTTISNIVLQPK